WKVMLSLPMKEYCRTSSAAAGHHCFHADGSGERRAHSMAADRYPMTASNHTYSRLAGLSSQPGSGTGMPQSMSRVMARGLMSSSRLSENLSTLGRQSVRERSHSS